MESAFNIGRLFGIQFRVHYSWFFIFGLMTVFLAADVFPGAVPGQSGLTYWIMGAATALLFFVSVMLHEIGHSLVSRANGIPIGGITLFLFGGAAEMTREPPTAAAEIKMALAGPAASAGLAVLFWLIYIAFLGATNTVAAVGLWLAQINLIVAGFNLLPGFPLDGGRVLRGAWWHFSGDHVKATRVAVAFGRVVGLAIIGVGLFTVIRDRDFLAGIWLAILGWYLENSARLSLRQFGLQQWMKGRTVAEVMERDCPAVAGDDAVDEVQQQFPGRRCFRVTAPGQPDGAAYLPVAGSLQGSSKMAELSIPLDHAIEISPGDDLLLLTQQMNEAAKYLAVVKENGVATGLVFLDALIDLVNNSGALPKKAAAKP